MRKLYGNGINDDFGAIQELLDSGICEVALPAPAKFYLIGDTLKLHSGQSLTLPTYAVIKLADGSSRHMLENADPAAGDENFEVRGGIWDFNNKNQAKNPFHFPDPALPGYDGVIFNFKNVRNFKLRSLTFKDPVTYCVILDTASDFTVEGITFDFNYGNPWAVNMDGIHLNGNCHDGLLRDLKGACYDDLVALNADEGSNGPISDIEIDGVFSRDCHSAVRLLSVKNRVEHIHIHNIHGTFYQYCIGITKYYAGSFDGCYDALVFENIHASKAERLSVYMKDGSMEYPLIWFESDMLVKNAVVRCVYRSEEHSGVPLIKLEARSKIENLSVSEVAQRDICRKTSAVIENRGEIGRLRLKNVRTDNGVVYLDGGVTGEYTEE